MTEIADRYRRLSGHLGDLIAAVPADRWSSPSPCEEWTAIELVQHVVDTQSLFRGLAGREPTGAPAAADDPVAAWQVASSVVQDDLDNPARAGTTFQGFFGETTYEDAVDRYANMDLVVHGWDLTRATGGDEHLADEDIERVQASLAGFGDMLRSPGVCGPAVEVAADADAQTKLLGALGRQA